VLCDPYVVLFYCSVCCCCYLYSSAHVLTTCDPDFTLCLLLCLFFVLSVLVPRDTCVFVPRRTCALFSLSLTPLGLLPPLLHLFDLLYLFDLLSPLTLASSFFLWHCVVAVGSGVVVSTRPTKFRRTDTIHTQV
jgi:hypothetical protein